MAEEDIRKLLSDLDKLEEGMKRGIFKRREPAEATTGEIAPVDEENGLTENEKLNKRKKELKQLIEVLETEFRESSISEKTYNEAINKSKQELIQIENKLKKLSPSPEPGVQPTDGYGGRLLELEKMKIDMQNQINELTLKFSKAEISDEDYKSRIEALRKQIQEIEGEIFRLDKGKSVVEAVPMGKIPRQEAEPEEEGIITQTIEGVTDEDAAEETETKPEPEKEQAKEEWKKPKKKRFSIKSKLFGEKEEKKGEKQKKGKAKEKTDDEEAGDGEEDENHE